MGLFDKQPKPVEQPMSKQPATTGFTGKNPYPTPEPTPDVEPPKQFTGASDLKDIVDGNDYPFFEQSYLALIYNAEIVKDLQDAYYALLIIARLQKAVPWVNGNAWMQDTMSKLVGDLGAKVRNALQEWLVKEVERVSGRKWQS